MEPQNFFLPAFALLSLFASAFSKVPVTVYYESLCPDSRYFIQSVLNQQYDRLADKIDLTLVPFGKSKIWPDGHSQCQHGPRECEGNKIQACALSQLSPGKAQVDYVNCAMGSSGYSHQTCVDNAGISWAVVQACMENPLGTELMLRNQEETFARTPAPPGKRHGPTFVPTIVLNNLYNQEDQDLAYTDLEVAVCKYIAC